MAIAVLQTLLLLALKAALPATMRRLKLSQALGGFQQANGGLKGLVRFGVCICCQHLDAASLGCRPSVVAQERCIASCSPWMYAHESVKYVTKCITLHKTNQARS